VAETTERVSNTADNAEVPRRSPKNLFLTHGTLILKKYIKAVTAEIINAHIS
jgi:hypothetical protein